MLKLTNLEVLWLYTNLDEVQLALNQKQITEPEKAYNDSIFFLFT